MPVKKHKSAALFIPHAGCPHRCSFCDQNSISGRTEAPSPDEVAKTLSHARLTLGDRVGEAEIAFFGGSFTAVEPSYRRALLGAAQPFLGEGGFSGIRVSTRPDAIDRHVLAEMKEYGVTVIELGAQSMSDTVLNRNLRGHTSAQVAAAARLVREQGFALGLQMMTGLYGDDDRTARYTADRIASLEPDMVRIYPAVVLRDTYLAELAEAGRYRPQELEEAVALCAELLLLFQAKGIPVIRMGLHDSDAVAGRRIAGPYHPAFRELCESRILLDRAMAQIREREIPTGGIRLDIAPGAVSKMTGQRRVNLDFLRQKGYYARVREREGIAYLQVRVSDDSRRA